MSPWAPPMPKAQLIGLDKLYNRIIFSIISNQEQNSIIDKKTTTTTTKRNDTTCFFKLLYYRIFRNLCLCEFFFLLQRKFQGPYFHAFLLLHKYEC